MRQALLVAIVSAVVVLAACTKGAPTAVPSAATPEAVEEKFPTLEFSAELSVEVGELDELDLSTLLAGSEELATEDLAVPELVADTSTDVVFDLEFEVEGPELP